jgi:hypothetical protein
MPLVVMNPSSGAEIIEEERKGTAAARSNLGRELCVLINRQKRWRKWRRW